MLVKYLLLMQMPTMIRDGLLKNWLVMAMILAATLGPYGSYLCMTERGTMQVESVWSGECLVQTRWHVDSAGALAVEVGGSRCGACTDISLHIDSSLPSDTRTAVRLVLAADGLSHACDQSAQSPQRRHSGELTFDPPQNSTLSALRGVVLLI